MLHLSPSSTSIKFIENMWLLMPQILIEHILPKTEFGFKIRNSCSQLQGIRDAILQSGTTVHHIFYSGNLQIDAMKSLQETYERGLLGYVLQFLQGSRRGVFLGCFDTFFIYTRFADEISALSRKTNGFEASTELDTYLDEVKKNRH